MKQPEHKSFPAHAASRLKSYVYRLIDPRNGETFYVGKGRGSRVFSHIRAEQIPEGDDLENKIKRIREIRLAGFEVAHVIHRHGMNEATAFEVEAALIDSYPGLTNIAGGTGGRPVPARPDSSWAVAIATAMTPTNTWCGASQANASDHTLNGFAPLSMEIATATSPELIAKNRAPATSAGARTSGQALDP